MLVSLRGGHTEGLHTELYKFQSNVSANNSTTEYHTDLRLGVVVLSFLIYNVTNTWFLLSSGRTVKAENDFLTLYVLGTEQIRRYHEFCFT